MAKKKTSRTLPAGKPSRGARRATVGKSPSKRPGGPATLCIDIGGTGLKLIVLDATGQPLGERTRVATPHPATPRALLGALGKEIAGQPGFDRVSVGFPGVVVGGVTLTAPNLGEGFAGFRFERAIERMTGKPTRVCNDADVQGLAAVGGRGVEMVITLGTGMGSGLYLDGKLVPNLELAHHVFRGDKTYEEHVGKKALARVGKKRWRKRVRDVAEHLAPVFNYATLYVGGGNARLLHAEDLPRNVKIVSNEAGLLGGLALWR